MAETITGTAGAPGRGPHARRHEDGRIPRAVLRAAGLMVLVALLAAGLGRFASIGGYHPTTGVAVDHRMLRFEERADGVLAVYEPSATPGAADLFVADYAPTEAGFIRGVLRSVRHIRRSHAAPMAGPLRLERTSGGYVALIDPATEQRIELVGFGRDNLASFAELLTKGRKDT